MFLRSSPPCPGCGSPPVVSASGFPAYTLSDDDAAVRNETSENGEPNALRRGPDFVVWDVESFFLGVVGEEGGE